MLPYERETYQYPPPPYSLFNLNIGPLSTDPNKQELFLDFYLKYMTSFHHSYKYESVLWMRMPI